MAKGMHTGRAGPTGLNTDQIKLIAALAMLGNHIAHVFLTTYSIPYILLTSFGYITAPAMCFFMVENSLRSRSIPRYVLRLFLFGLLAQAPYIYCFFRNDSLQEYVETGLTSYNMLFSLLLCLLVLQVMRSALELPVKALLLVGLVFLSSFCDWPVMAPLMTILFEAARTHAQGEASRLLKGRLLAYTAAAAMLVFFEAVSLQEWIAVGRLSQQRAALVMICDAAAIAVSAFLTLFCRGGRDDRRRSMLEKYFFYLFYPGHLAVLAVLKACHLFGA